MKAKNEHRQGKNKETFLMSLLFIGLAGAVAGVALNAARDAHFLERAGLMIRELLIAGLPFYIPAMGLLLALPSAWMLRRGKNLIKNWDGENEASAEQAERLISLSSSLSAGCLPLLLLVQVGSMLYAEKVLVQAITFLELIALVIVVVLLQKGSVDWNNRLHPENPMNFYDENAVEHYVEGCDEAERKHLGEAAWKSYQATVSACFVLGILLIPLQLMFDVGILPTVVVTIILLVSFISFAMEEARQQKRR